jgi:hypothetical protein
MDVLRDVGGDHDLVMYSLTFLPVETRRRFSWMYSEM